MNSPGALPLLFMLSLTGSVLGNLLAIYLLLTRPVIVLTLAEDGEDGDVYSEGGSL